MNSQHWRHADGSILNCARRDSAARRTSFDALCAAATVALRSRTAAAAVAILQWKSSVQLTDVGDHPGDGHATSSMLISM